MDGVDARIDGSERGGAARIAEQPEHVFSTLKMQEREDAIDCRASGDVPSMQDQPSYNTGIFSPSQHKSPESSIACAGFQGLCIAK